MNISFFSPETMQMNDGKRKSMEHKDVVEHGNYQLELKSASHIYITIEHTKALLTVINHDGSHLRVDRFRRDGSQVDLVLRWCSLKANNLLRRNFVCACGLRRQISTKCPTFGGPLASKSRKFVD